MVRTSSRAAGAAAAGSDMSEWDLILCSSCRLLSINSSSSGPLEYAIKDLTSQMGRLCTIAACVYVSLVCGGVEGCKESVSRSVKSKPHLILSLVTEKAPWVEFVCAHVDVCLKAGVRNKNQS